MLVLFITALGFLLRIVNLAELFYFTHDEETIVWRVMPLLRDHDPFLLGGVTPFHVHLGPWFYYLSALILWLSHFNPLGWGIAAALVSLLTLLLLFHTGSLFFNRRVGLIALILYATSFLMIAFDRHWWPIYFDPLISLLVFISLYKVVKGSSTFIIPLSLALIFGFHTDPSNWALFLLTIITWIKFRPSIHKKYAYISLFIFIISFAPLVLFDVLHRGVNIFGISQYLNETQSHQGLNLSRFWSVLLFIPQGLSRLIYAGNSDLTSIYSYCRQFLSAHPIPLIFTFIALVSFGILAWRHRRQSAYWLIAIYFLIIFIGLNFYGNFFNSDLFNHYLATLFPIFFLILAVLIDHLKLIGIIALTVFVFFNLSLFSRISTQDSFTAKNQAVAWAIKQADNQPFSLDSLSSCLRYNGTRYLFTLAGSEPDSSFVDSNFGWLYAHPSHPSPPTIRIVFVHTDFFGILPAPIIASHTFGPWKVLIVRVQ